MLRYTFKIQQAYEEGYKEGLEEARKQRREQAYKQGLDKAYNLGFKQGREEIYQAWYADWEKRKAAAEAKGIPFDDSPPPNPNGHSDKQK